MNKLIFSFLLLFSLVLAGIFAQSSKDDLLVKRDKILDEINFTNKLIKSNEKKKGSTLQSVRLLDRKISDRNKLIRNYYSEIRVIENQIIDRNLTIEKLQKDLEIQKSLYADFIQYSYKNISNYTTAVYLLASENISQFYLRKKYLDQLNAARSKKIRLINSIEERVTLEVEKLNKDKVVIGDRILQIKNENNNLKGEKKSREYIVAQLSKEERELKKSLAEKHKIEEEIKKRLEEVIRAEASKSSFSVLTPEQQLISDDFEQNKGRLPWPTGQGVITEKFGEHWHPVIKGVKVRNNGIDISTVDNSSVRVIFNGSVSKIFAIKGSNYTVIVRHGKYYTVYHNLKEVKVNVGDYLKTKSTIGYVGEDKSGKESIIHFEIWNGMDKLNPEAWISK